MARRALSARLVASLLLAWTTRAQAAHGPATLVLDGQSCDESWLTTSELTRALRAELQADGITVLDGPAQGTSDAKLSVRVSCSGTRAAELRLSSERSPRERLQTLSLSDADASSRARVLALAASDWLRTEWAELSQPEAAFPVALPAGAPVAAASEPVRRAPAPAASPPPIPTNSASPPDRAFIVSERPSSRASAARFSLGLASRWFVDYSNVVWGGELGADLGRVRLHGEALFGRASDPLGTASLGSAAFGIGYRVLDLRVSAVHIEGRPLLAGGVTWLRGDSTSTAVAISPATTFYGDLRFVLEASLARAVLSPRLALELGRATGFVARAADRNLAATGGSFVGANLSAQY